MTEASSRAGETILSINDISIALPKGADREHAVRNVSLEVKRGEILCIVGESGSGKSVLTSAIMNDVPPRLTVEKGQVIFDGKDVLHMSDKELCDMRGARISMIYQEPMAALNPSIKIGPQVDEVFKLHRPEISAEDRKKETIKLFEQMRLPQPPRIYDSYPHQVSGGQCQRVVIAMALACQPDLLIADEPTTALDVTVQAQILDLIQGLQAEMGMAAILITHDLGVIAENCDLVVVMYAGRVVERAPVKELFANPMHAYTRGLLNSIPRLSLPPKSELNTIPGMVASLSEMASGCRFCQRLGRRSSLGDERPELREVSPGHWVEACPECCGGEARESV